MPDNRLNDSIVSHSIDINRCVLLFDDFHDFEFLLKRMPNINTLSLVSLVNNRLSIELFKYKFDEIGIQ